MAAYFGSTIAEVRHWLTVAQDELVEVDRKGARSFALAIDIDTLNEKPPSGSNWPVRLLHRFDPYVMSAVGIKDKDWLLDTSNIKHVWRPGGQIEAVVLDGGRVIGTWRYTRKTKGLLFYVAPFYPLSQRLRREITKKAKAIADFLEQEVVGIELS